MYHFAWIALWCLWPLILFLGGQGASPLLFILGIFGAIVSWPFGQIPRYTLFGGGFLLWVMVTSFWSPESRGLLIWEPDKGAIAIGEAAMRMLLIGAGAACALLGAMKLSTERSAFVLRFAKFALYASLVLLSFSAAITYLNVDTMTVWFISPDGGGLARIPPLGAFREYLMERPGETVQNVERHMTLFVLSLPIFCALAIPSEGRFKWPIFILLLVYCFILAMDTWAKAAQLAMFVGLLGATAAYRIGPVLFSYLGRITAAGVVIIPLFSKFLPHFEDPISNGIPLSVYSRLESWRYVGARFWEKPFLGWGIDASKSWRDTHETGTGILTGEKLVPGHPHNMFLQIGAETGIVGGLLAAATVVLIGERLSRLRIENQRAVMAVAAFWCVALVYMTLSFSMWNDAFWGAIAFMAAGLIALSKLGRTS